MSGLCGCCVSSSLVWVVLNWYVLVLEVFRYLFDVLFNWEVCSLVLLRKGSGFSSWFLIVILFCVSLMFIGWLWVVFVLKDWFFIEKLGML